MSAFPLALNLSFICTGFGKLAGFGPGRNPTLPMTESHCEQEKLPGGALLRTSASFAGVGFFGNREIECAEKLFGPCAAACKKRKGTLKSIH